MTTRCFLPSAVFVTTLLAGGCADLEPAPAPTSAAAATAQAISSGTPDDTSLSTVYVIAKVDGQIGYCTGVVVSPHVVLTAAHCSRVNATYSIFLGSDYNDASERNDPEKTLAVAKHRPHPDHDRRRNLNDIGVLITADPIPIAPAKINREPLGSSDVGESIRIVGYGQTTGGNSKPTGRRNQGATTIASLDATTLSMTSLPNICLVDSGGPTFMRRNGEDVVIGIHFIIESVSCDGEGTDTRVDPYVDFIDAEVAKADPPVEEVPEDVAPADSDAETAPEPPPSATTSSCSVGLGDGRSSWTGGFGLLALAALGALSRRRRGGPH